MVNKLGQPLGEHRANAEARLLERAVVSLIERTEELVITSVEGIIRCRTIHRRPEDERLSASLVLGVKTEAVYFLCTYEGLAPKGSVPATAPAYAGLARDEQAQEERQRRVQRRRFRKQEFLDSEYTRGCLGCTAVKNGRRPIPPHWESCRERLVKES